jgi:hypothetical protein
LPRRSLESITVKPIGVTAIFAEPPGHLSKRAQAIWKEITLARPADFFDAAGKLLLAALCCHTESFEMITKELESERRSAEPTDERMRRLGTMRYTESAAMIAIATRLRLTNQSRYTAATGRTAAERGSLQQMTKPWEK